MPPRPRAYVLTAGACVLVALLALAAGVARHRRSYRHDVAALRVMGIGVGTARRAGRTELAAPGPPGRACAVAVGGWVAVQLLLGGLPLLTPSPAAQPLDTGARAPALALPAVLAAVAVLVVGGRARAVRDCDHPTLPAAGRGAPMIQLLAAVLRGLRARALLSVGSIVLTALAIGSAVLGPIFSEAVTNSYVVTRLREAPAAATGLIRVLELKSQLDPQAARDLAVAESAGPRRGPVGRARSPPWSRSATAPCAGWSRSGRARTSAPAWR